MELAREHKAKSIAFPAISTGIYRFPRRRAAEIAVRAVRENLSTTEVNRVIFCCFDEETAGIYNAILAARP
jgi:O-acetyl-ADP-ribose deacetylase (regulator of RNase III)